MHRGQTIDQAGTIDGEPPETLTLGFRSSAVDNHFRTAGDVAADEWKTAQARDRETAKRRCGNSCGRIPYEPPEVDLQPLDRDAVKKRSSGLKKGIIPPDCLGVAVGIDTGKRELHWQAQAVEVDRRHRDHRLRHAAHGRRSTRHDGRAVGSLASAEGLLCRGWHTQHGQAIGPAQVWIDSGYHEHREAVYQFCDEANQGCQPGQEIYRPTKGYGEGQVRQTRYFAPKQKTGEVRYIGHEYHLTRIKTAGTGLLLVHVNADHWKSEYHQGLAMPATEPLAVTLYDAPSMTEHDDFCPAGHGRAADRKVVRGPRRA